MTTRLTLAEARTALAELLQLLDVEGSPELVATINRAIALSQRSLAMTERWLVPMQRMTQTTGVGRTVYPSPPLEADKAVGIQFDASYPPTYLAGGLAMDDLPVPAGVPTRYGIRSVQEVASVTVGAGGSGYTNGAAVTFTAPADGWAAAGTLVATAGVVTGVTITEPGGGYTSAPTATIAGAGSGAVLTAVLGDASALVLSPPPQEAWPLVIDWRETPPMSLANGDRLIMDEMAVIYDAAIMIAPSTKSPRASTIIAERDRYLGGLRGANKVGASFQPGASSRQQNGMVYRNGRWWRA